MATPSINIVAEVLPILTVLLIVSFKSLLVSIILSNIFLTTRPLVCNWILVLYSSFCISDSSLCFSPAVAKQSISISTRYFFGASSGILVFFVSVTTRILFLVSSKNILPQGAE